MFKKIITWLGILAAAVGAFILGRGTNRSGVSRAGGIADNIGDGIDRAGENNRDVEDGIKRTEKLVEDTKRNNRDALDSVRRAKDILSKAKGRT